MQITENETLGNIVATDPDIYKVFMDNGLDFCCGGQRSLGSACKEAGLDAGNVISQLNEFIAQSQANSQANWVEASNEALIQHILIQYHEPLKASIPRLKFMADKVLNAHRDAHGEMLSRLREIVLGLGDELTSHMYKEEEILFPRIIEGQYSMLGGPISVMEVEHANAGNALHKIQALTDNFTVPNDACATFKAYWHELEQVSIELQKHIHLENNILFPRVLNQ